METLHQNICLKLEDKIRYYWLLRSPAIMNITDREFPFPRLLECIYNNSVFVVYRCLYNKYAEKHPIRYYTKMLSFDGKVERHDAEYNDSIYHYRKIREEKKEDFQKAFGSDFEQITEPFIKYGKEKKGEPVKRRQGQELTQIQYEEVGNIRIYKIFEALSKNRLHSVKKISYNTFKTKYFYEIEGKKGALYKDIIFSGYESSPNFFKCMHFFEIECNCSIEKNYLIAKAVKGISKKEDREKEMTTLLKSNFFADVLGNKVIDHMVLGCKEILELYSKGIFKAEDIVTLFCVCNEVMNLSVCETLDELHRNIPELKFYVSQQAEDFFEEYLAHGQHINEKNLEEINVMDFRKLFERKI